jgi:hypothetical protein
MAEIVLPEIAAPGLGEDVRARTPRSSHVGFIEYVNERFLEECRAFGTDAIAPADIMAT